MSLSGDYGDELFCGYTSFQMSADVWGKLSHLPRQLWQLAASVITRVPPILWDKVGRLLSMSRVGDKLHKVAAQSSLEKRSLKVEFSQSEGVLHEEVAIYR